MKQHTAAWWIAHGSFSRATQVISHLGLVLLSWCITIFQVRSTNFPMFVSNTHSCLLAHILLIALSITQHTSALLSIQLNNIYLQCEYPSVLSYTQQSNHGPSPKRVSSIILICKNNPSLHLFISNICVFEFFSPYPVQVPPISYLN